jgi:hypothetical protein
VFLTAKKHYAKHHEYHAIHHNLTTISPPQNTPKSQNPQQNPPSCFMKYFLKNNPPPHSFRHQSRLGKRGTPHAASEVVLPNPAPQT